MNRSPGLINLTFECVRAIEIFRFYIFCFPLILRRSTLCDLFYNILLSHLSIVELPPRTQSFHLSEMASKRKSEPVKKTAKRGKKKTEDSFDSDLSDDYGDEVSGNGNGAAQPVTFDERAVIPKLPEELLASRDREPGHLAVAGMVTWDIVGKRADAKGGVKIRPNLWNFHRFTDEKYRRIVSGCASAHSVLVNMDRKALTLGKNFPWSFKLFIINNNLFF